MRRPLPNDQHGEAQRQWFDWALVALCLCALTFLIWGTSRRFRPEPVTVDPLRLSQGEILSGRGFIADGVFPATLALRTKPAMEFLGSWRGSDADTGAVTTGWYKVVPHAYIFICGYPNAPANSLVVEVAGVNRVLGRVPISPKSDPGEAWTEVELPLHRWPAATQFRIVAADQRTSIRGWVGFSQPFRQPGVSFDRLPEMCLVVLAAATSLVVFLVPGFMFCWKARVEKRKFSLVWLPFPGVILFSVLGLCAWLSPAFTSPRRLAQIGLFLFVICALYFLLRRPVSSFTSITERKVLVLMAVLASIGIARATYSEGPVGELYANTISRTFEVGGRSDSRIPFHVVQMIAYRKAPTSPFSQFLLGSWGFSHRGVLESLAVSPIVLAGPVTVAKGMPNEPWTVFDSQGFASFRIAATVLACICLIPAFGLARLFMRDEWALLAFLVVATAPFVVHETYFTWPKLEVAGCAMVAAYLLFTQRNFTSGLMVGVGYLFHPSGLFALPGMAGVVWLTTRSPKRAVLRFASVLSGVAVPCLAWRLVNWNHFEQAGFLGYFKMAGLAAPTALNWIEHRLNSIADTLIPLYAFVVHGRNPDIAPVDAVADPVAQFSLQYWVGLPFGVGIAWFFCLMRLCYVAWLKARGWLLLVFVLPFLFFALYWGAPDTGLLREGLHTWVVTLLLFAVVIWKRFETSRLWFWRLCSWALLFRAVEISALIVIPAVHSHRALTGVRFGLSDMISLLVLVSAPAWLCLEAFRLSEALRTGAERPSISGRRGAAIIGTRAVHPAPAIGPIGYRDPRL